jgi:glutamyl-tRNA reductase
VTAIGCISVTGCRATLDLLERLAYPRGDLAARLPGLRASSHARGLAVLSTCQRVEVYASWSGEPDTGALLAALAADRGVPGHAVAAAATTYHDDAAARHLLRVATGLESFALGETEIAGQVRAATEASRVSGGGDATLHRLLCTAISASRLAHRRAGVAATSRSVAGVAVDTVAASHGGTLAGQRLLVVGAGQVASVVVTRATALGAAVTVCNRTRRHAARFTAAGAEVVDLAELPARLATNDIAILATAAPHPLVDAELLRPVRPAGTGSLTLLDLSLPRNVDPSVRQLASVRLLDLADLRAGGADAVGALAADVAAVEEVIELELARYLRWSVGRSVSTALRRVRGDAEDVAREEIARIAGDVPVEIRSALERALFRMAHRLAHGPTRELLAAAEAGDSGLIALLAGLYEHDSPVAAAASAPDDPDAAGRFRGAALDLQLAQLGAGEHAVHERGVHAADQLAV